MLARPPECGVGVVDGGRAPGVRGPAGSRSTARGRPASRQVRPAQRVVGVEVTDHPAAAVVEDHQRRWARRRRAVVPRADRACRSGNRQVADTDVDLRSAEALCHLAHLSARGRDVLAEHQSVHAERAHPGQRQLQCRVQRVAVDGDLAATRQQPFRAGGHPRDRLEAGCGGDDLQPGGPAARLELRIRCAWQTSCHV